MSKKLFIKSFIAQSLLLS